MTGRNEDQPVRGPFARRGAGGSAWVSMHRALRDAIEWALDLAAKLAAPYPEEADAVESVRRFVEARLAGYAVEANLDDVLVTLGILIGAIENPTGADDERNASASIALDPDWAHAMRFGPPVMQHFPGASSRRPRAYGAAVVA